ncbi:MAG: hypothetical protein ACR2LJ_09550 [Acidimicrobiales bacterium]
MVSDSNRHDLYVALEHQLGQGPTDTLMQLLPPVGWADVARASDVESLGIHLRGEMAELRSELCGEMVGLRSELRGEMAELRSELRGEMGELRGEIKAQLPRLYAANIASMIGVAGLVLAAARLA